MGKKCLPKHGFWVPDQVYLKQYDGPDKGLGSSAIEKIDSRH